MAPSRRTALTRRGRRLRSALVLLVATGVVVAAGWVVWQGRTPVVVVERCVATAGGASAAFAPDQVRNAATIAGLSVRRGLPARAATIGIATAVQESKLRNLDYGDRDSLGLFQQRPSQGWGSPEQVQDPVYATNAFYDVLTRIEGYEELEVTDASDRVQRSAFPDAVADHEQEGRVFASALTGHSPAALECRLRPASGTGDVAGLAAALGTELLGEAPAVAETGALVVDVTGASEPERRAWAVAAFALAAADAYGVQRIAVADRAWDRGDGTGGWQPVDEPLPVGVVEITPAAG